uniref:Longin domain-containing protein n=1 Tax=Macaca fascicularis TaxID=9541 RepID=A0A7N9IFA6_MACFA
ANLLAMAIRGITPKVSHGWGGLSFVELAEKVLARISSENNQFRYKHTEYINHFIVMNSIFYLCISKDDSKSSRAKYHFKKEWRRRKRTYYGSRKQWVLPYAIFSSYSS